MKKIYSDDPLVHYKNSTISPERTRAEIDGILAEWAVKDTQWHWDPQHNDVFLQFRIEELVKDVPVLAVVKVECPIIWDRASPRSRPPRPEQVNWRVSMRAMHWFIKTHLEMAYVMQSEKVRAFLSHIKMAEEGRNLGDVVIPRLQQIQELAALPEIKKVEEQNK
jgi:hypothetical protein